MKIVLKRAQRKNNNNKIAQNDKSYILITIRPRRRLNFRLLARFYGTRNGHKGEGQEEDGRYG